MLKQPKTFAANMSVNEVRHASINYLILLKLTRQKTKKENIPPEEEFPVIKRKAEEVVAERPTKVVRKDDLLTRKKVPISTTTKPLKERESLNTKVNNFSSSLRSSVSLLLISFIHGLAFQYHSLHSPYCSCL